MYLILNKGLYENLFVNTKKDRNKINSLKTRNFKKIIKTIKK